MLEELHPQNADFSRIFNEEFILHISRDRLLSMSAPIGSIDAFKRSLKFTFDSNSWSPPLSDIELNDIKLGAEEFASGEAPVFDSVDELFAYIEEYDSGSENGTD